MHACSLVLSSLPAGSTVFTISCVSTAPYVPTILLVKRFAPAYLTSTVWLLAVVARLTPLPSGDAGWLDGYIANFWLKRDSPQNRLAGAEPG